MAEAIFLFKGLEVAIQCSKDDKIKEICQRFASKINMEINSLCFFYDGYKINGELKFNEQANYKDNQRNIMNILVNEINNTIIRENIMESNEILCPQCNENIFVKIDDYKINLCDCKNKHNLKNITLKQLETIEKIDISKIICDKCKIRSKSNSNNFYVCLNCDKHLCPLCKEKHIKRHKVINYDIKNYICKKHNESFIKYCYECKMNLCIRCEKEHDNHKCIYFRQILPEDNKNDELKQYIDKLKEQINNIIVKLKEIKDNMDTYYNISTNIMNNKNRNYEILRNINEFIKYNSVIINDIKVVINENDNNKKFENLMNLYETMNNNNYIFAEIEIKKEDINKNIRIINSFEQYNRENNIKEEDDYYKYENENEIKDNCQIKINNKTIKFNYFYKFNEEGKYEITK